ncbi:MAG: HesA/MoeB/ThiF family protein [Rikenellaceae bacterium]
MENKRYERNLLCEGFTKESQLLLESAKVLIVGAGGLGSYVIQHLAAAGVGVIGIVEFDVVSESNLNRQILFKTDDIGHSKAIAARRRVEELNPLVKVELYNEKFEQSNGLSLVEKFDIVVDCTDNYKARFAMDSSCEKLQKPLVHASVESMRGVATTFLYENGINYRSLYGDDEKIATAVGVLSPIVGVLGSIEASEVVKLITGIGSTLSGKLFTINLLNFKSEIFDFV